MFLHPRQTLGHNLLNSLVEFWPLNEPMGVRFGAHQRTPATPTLTPAMCAGVPGSGALAMQCAVAGASNYLTTAAGAQWAFGDTDYTVACWGRNDYTTSPYLLAATIAGDAYPMYSLQIQSNDFLFYTSPDGSHSYYTYTATGATQGVWYYVVGRHDSVNNLLMISVNNGAVTASTAYSLGGRSSSTRKVYIGGTEGAFGRRVSVQGAGIWNRLLTADEESWLYNGGVGRDYPFV
jgi:hypothetical protein